MLLMLLMMLLASSSSLPPLLQDQLSWRKEAQVDTGEEGEFSAPSAFTGPACCAIAHVDEWGSSTYHFFDMHFFLHAALLAAQRALPPPVACSPGFLCFAAPACVPSSSPIAVLTDFDFHEKPEFMKWYPEGEPALPVTRCAPQPRLMR